jgi:hypothetical protein
MFQELGYAQALQDLGLDKTAGVFGAVGKAVGGAVSKVKGMFGKAPKAVGQGQHYGPKTGLPGDEMFTGKMDVPGPIKPPPPAAASAPAGAAPTGAPSATEPAKGPGMLGWMKKHPYLSSIGGTAAGYGLGTVMNAGVQPPMMSPQQMYQQQQGMPQ